ncbi:type II toxin-antitoxin system RelE/ParE family toxin [Neogemmobacter tilapiae]|uniref:Plasmid stabilization protein ParE n=1 Tax=Neogemmobacter tilapiae TaxID=875041 RepID=A0A918WHV0_9RHOB|nr:type II toxin-antitoxin system RelE/ParE family toxin [Gemmobacter tilapiae]GHC52970.1 plasmid stabilization protein ParE [Gemmobacter tilapiae]
MKAPALEFSSRARRDLDEVRDWTIQNWSEGQWRAYYRGFAIAFRRIAADPDCGRPREPLGKGMRSLAYEKHLIFFAPVSDVGGAVVILRIIHQRRNFTALTYLDDLEG